MIMQSSRTSKNQDKYSSRQVVLAGLLFVLGFSLLILHKNESLGEGEQTFASYSDSSANLSPAALENIDRELKKTDLSSRYNRAYAEEQNKISSLGVDMKNLSERAGAVLHPIDMRKAKHEHDIINEQREAEQPLDRRALTPDERISEKLARDEWAVEYDQKYQEAYVKAFVEKARQDGVDVQLNKNLDVVGIGPSYVARPIRVPQSIDQSASTGGKR
jgi:hypothetical protein